MGGDTKPIYGYLQYPHMDIYLRKNPPMDIAKTIATNLAAWMEANPSLDTFKKVSAKSKVGFGTIQRAKNGEGNITVDKLTLIAEAFCRHPAELLVQPGDSSPSVYTPSNQAQKLSINEPTPLPYKTLREERMDEVRRLLEKTDDFGLVALLEKAKDVAKEYPLAKPNQDKSSA